MRDALSKLIFALSCLAVALAALATLAWAGTIMNRYALPAAYFVVLFMPAFVAASSLLITIPSRLLYRRTRQRRDCASFWMSLCSSAAVLTEAVALYATYGSVRFYGPGG